MKRVSSLFTMIPLLVLLLVYSTSTWSKSKADTTGYRTQRSHKGFTSKKKDFKIDKIEKKKSTVEVKKRSPLKVEAFERFTKERLQQKTKEQIQTMEQIIQTSEKGERARLYFQLAELYWENSRYHDHIGHSYDDFRDRPEWTEKAKLQQKAFQTSKQFKRKAAANYRKIIQNYPNFPRLCEAYFFLGKNLSEMGSEKLALQSYKKMLSQFRYPKCPFIPNAYLAFGEYYFNQGNVRNAQKMYEQVLNFQTASIYGFALYKVGWCQYNLVKYKDSLRTFISVVKHAKNSNRVNYRHNERRRLALLKEAMRDLVLAYSQIPGVEMARDAQRRFTDIAGTERGIEMMKTLGKLYRQQGKHPQVIVLYKSLMTLHPDQPASILYQLYITQAIDRSKTKQDTVQAVEQLVSKVKQFESSHPQDKDYIQGRKEVLDQIKEYAKYRLYEAQKTRRNDFYTEASGFFKSFLSIAPKDKDSYELYFWNAEILYKLRKFEDAAKEYEKVYKLDPKGKFSNDAGYNTVLAYNNLHKKNRKAGANIQAKQGNITKQALPQHAKQLLASSEDFLKHFPTGERAIDVSYKAALLYYEYNHFDKALPRFFFLVDKHPKHQYAKFSAHFILDTYQLQKKWVTLNKTAWKFYRNKDLGDSQFKKEVREIISQSGFRTCFNISQEKKNEAAAKCFMKIATEFPDNKKLASQALYNAMLDYWKAKQFNSALQASKTLIEKYPDSEFYKKSLLKLADHYATVADFTNASKYYKLYHTKFATKKNPLWDIRQQIGLFSEADGDQDTAIQQYKILLADKAFQKTENKKFVTLYWRVASTLKENGKLSQYAWMMKQFDEKRLGPGAMRLHARMEYALARKKNGRTNPIQKNYSKHSIWV